MRLNINLIDKYHAAKSLQFSLWAVIPSNRERIDKEGRDMKILIAVFAALALSACASPPASNAPALAASTSKAPYDYAMCVLPKWQRQAPGVALVEEGRGYRLADAGQWLEVQPARGGSLVRIHDQQPWVTRGAFIDAARTCS
ncbi:hypothetical protein C3O69_02433 [Pseudomonas aeruginosa]|nr:hypothetical protein C3O69_02433 [Pseudomonas aeruginosa]